MYGQRRAAAKGLLLTILLLAVSCKTSDDAKSLATQLTATAKQLQGYYTALSGVVDEHGKLERLQQATTGVPLDRQDLNQLADIMKQLDQRATAARELAKLAAAFTELTGSKAPSDVSEAATELGSALSSIQGLPGASDAAEALPGAGQVLTQLLQERDERKAAKGIEPTLTALSQMFAREKPVYDSMERTYIGLAQAIALDLVTKNQVDPGSLMQPALKPFDLASRMPTEKLPAGLSEYAKEQIRSKGEEDIAAHAKASDAMEKALAEMAKRTQQLARDGHLSARDLPFSLDDIEGWVGKHKKSSGE